MRYLSVCSGIEAATVAWHPLGWRALAFSEIDKFPSAVLAHHYPAVPNYGDITRFKEWPDADPDVLVGGTPCQSFSVAGLRKGLDDPRGSLMLSYLALAGRYRPRWVVWENVPGVLSADDGEAFGSLLGGLAELGYGFAYRVLDAQYFNLAQRRARVFVVGCLGDWRRAAAVLFERESLSGHPAPRREAGEGTAGCLTPGAHPGGYNGQDAYNDMLVAHSHANGGCMPAVAFDARQSDVLQYGDMSGPLDTDGHTIAVAFAENQRAEVITSDTAGSLKVGGGKPGQGYPAVQRGM
jgi:DNA (cytosine-5)-methyltransferase 1